MKTAFMNPLYYVSLVGWAVLITASVFHERWTTLTLSLGVTLIAFFISSRKD